MPLPAHMTVQGAEQGEIQGSCTQQGREGTILVQQFDHEVSIPTDRQTGAAAGKRVHSPLTITKIVDKSSPKLYQALVTGEELTTVEIKWYRRNQQAQEEHYFTTKIEGATIVSIKPTLPNCLLESLKSLGHMEEVSFTYRKATWVWEPDGLEAEDDWQVPV